MESYEIFKNKFLGKGSYSKVYLGKNKKTGKFVAVKMIKKRKLSLKSLKIIRDEMELMFYIKENSHKNIVECYDVFEDDDFIFIVMEYCDSGNLRSILKKGPIKEKYAQFFFFQLANGLRYLYQKKIFHRDLKPKNILLTNNTTVIKIADFGFAKRTDQETNLKSHKQVDLYETICGSPLYMAPEIMSGVSYNIQTDLWSLGMILYEMLYNEHPFQNCKSIPQLKDCLNSQVINIPPKNNKNIDVSEKCIDLLKKLLINDVSKRLTWDEFFADPWINLYECIVPKHLDQEIKIIENYIDKIEPPVHNNIHKVSMSLDDEDIMMFKIDN